jgi:membrane protease YdiL (CAAX protease family)
MTDQQRNLINCFTACLAACSFALFASHASSSLAQFSVQSGGPDYMREPLNGLIAGLLYLMWWRWRPAARYSSPKWGQVGIGLGIGLTLGVMLPGAALGLMSIAGAVTLKAPTVSGLTLAVPLLFLIAHGFAEESLVRGIAQREGHDRFGALGGVALSAICFCALQGFQGYLDAWNVLNGALFGACLGFAALGPGGIWTAIGAHAGWSWLEIALLGQPGQIVKWQTWLVGSGPDSYGSPAFSIVLLVVLTAQLALHLRVQKSKS